MLDLASAGPLPVAPRVWLHDAGAPPPAAPPGTVVLAAYRSSVFGDGSHPTTRLCARAVDLVCRLERPRAALDVGTGTGILARLARAHGVPFVVATDVDPVALAAARANASLDAHPGELLVTEAAPDAFGARFDLVVANILEPVLLELADALVAALGPRGTLLLSGFTAPQAPALRAAFAVRGASVVAQARLGPWSLLQLGRAPG